MVRGSCQAIALALLGLCWAGAAHAQTPETRTVVLHPARTRELRINFNYNFGNVLPPFQNEPALDGKVTARGLIPTVPPTPLLRNIAANELYLKTDHSRDFSAGGLTTYRSRYDGHVLFQGLRVATERETLTIPYTLDLYTYETGCAGWLLVKSGWEGSCDLEGQRWDFQITDNLDGRIDSNDILFLTHAGSTPGGVWLTECPVPGTLFFGGRTFHLDFAFKSAADQVVLEMTLSELHPPLAELNIETAGCQHLRLHSESLTAVLNAPAGRITLPVGTYRVENCIPDARRSVQEGLTFAGCSRQVSVQTGQAASLRIGQPLSNSVTISRDRNLLQLGYQLLGAGGERYECRNWANRTSFQIYKGPLRIAGGTFPFG